MSNFFISVFLCANCRFWIFFQRHWKVISQRSITRTVYFDWINNQVKFIMVFKWWRSQDYYQSPELTTHSSKMNLLILPKTHSHCSLWHCFQQDALHYEQLPQKFFLDVLLTRHHTCINSSQVFASAMILNCWLAEIPFPSFESAICKVPL